MHLLIGVPLAIFRLVFGFVMLAVRLIVPIAVIAAIVLFLRSRQSQDGGPSTRQEEQPPRFDGPVYTVDYEDVTEEKDDKGEGV